LKTKLLSIAGKKRKKKTSNPETRMPRTLHTEFPSLVSAGERFKGAGVASFEN
jgi:hypothetical protein